MIKIILDTNFLIYCAKQKIDYYRKINELISNKYQIIVLSSVLKEFKSIIEKAKKSSDRKAAILALKILEHYTKNKQIKIIETDKNPDKAIANLVEKQKDIVVATQDRELKKLIKKKIYILTIKQKKHLELL